MNPYLEQSDTWEEFHGNFMYRAQEILQPALPPHYVAKVEMRLILHELTADERRFLGRGDLGVATDRERPAGSVTGVLEAPLHLRLPAVEVEKHRYLEIRDRRGRQVIAVVELLSPSNKSPGVDRDDYLAKRRQVLAGTTHLVEIDLRRGGQRPTPPELPTCDYYALVSRYEARPDVAVWPVALGNRLPEIPIPLGPADVPVKLDLQAVLDRAYDAAGYERTIYFELPEPPLSPEAEIWARQFIPQRP
jgi:hypothetical protein